jgi:hypothetical protein
MHNKLQITLFLATLILTFLTPTLSFTSSSEQKLTIQGIKSNIAHSVRIKNGLNNIDIDGDNAKDIIMNGYRGNITAHDFDAYSFYIFMDKISNIVAISDSDDVSKDKYEIFTHKGADCILRDIRLFKNKDEKSYNLVIAEREFGETYVDEKKVTFSLYKLDYDNDETRFIFRKYGEIKSKNNYCDVEEAFKKELDM